MACALILGVFLTLMMMLPLYTAKILLLEQKGKGSSVGGGGLVASTDLIKGNRVIRYKYFCSQSNVYPIFVADSISRSIVLLSFYRIAVFV